MPIDLQQHWNKLLQKVDLTIEQGLSQFQLIKDCYSEKHRAYHNLNHLQHVFAELEGLEAITPAAEFAVFYHDVVYKPGSESNELKSADIAKQTLEGWSLETVFCDRVYQLIMATKSHRTDANDLEASLFLDADMAILGSNTDSYLEYARAIRQEHKQYPDFLYNSGRKKFLKQTLTSERLFLSDYFYNLYEHKARENITAELKLLE